jgi:hypothetical protein
MGSPDCQDIKIAMEEGYFRGTWFNPFFWDFSGFWGRGWPLKRLKSLRKGVNYFRIGTHEVCFSDLFASSYSFIAQMVETWSLLLVGKFQFLFKTYKFSLLFILFYFVTKMADNWLFWSVGKILCLFKNSKFQLRYLSRIKGLSFKPSGNYILSLNLCF